MSRGALLLRCVAQNTELDYIPVMGAARRGQRPQSFQVTSKRRWRAPGPKHLDSIVGGWLPGGQFIPSSNRSTFDPFAKRGVVRLAAQSSTSRPCKFDPHENSIALERHFIHPNFPPLRGDIEVDVLVVGAGITGVMSLIF